MSDSPSPSILTKELATSRQKKTLREQGWLRAGLGIGSALLTQELASHWAQHLAPTDIYPLVIAVGMSFFNLHIFRLKPAIDHHSRLRALWFPNQKKIAIWCCILGFLVSLWFSYTRLNRPVREVSLAEITSLRPISRGPMMASGLPKVDEQPYRWVFSEPGYEEDAPYLTPLKEFKGQLIVVSDRPLKSPLLHERGWISELSIFARPHYVAYRNYMGLAPHDPIYLFDIRGVWWFDPHALSAILLSLILLVATMSSSTRDPSNTSRLLYIPPELRNLDDDLDETMYKHEGTPTQETPEDTSARETHEDTEQTIEP